MNKKAIFSQYNSITVHTTMSTLPYMHIILYPMPETQSHYLSGLVEWVHNAWEEEKEPMVSQNCNVLIHHQTSCCDSNSDFLAWLW